MVGSKHPDKVLQLLAYQTTIVREARCCRGARWQAYDTMFRQHAATDPFTDWSKLNSSLYAVTFLAQSNGRGRCYQYCLESDHGGQECALAPKYQPDRPQRSGGWGPMAGGRLGEGRSDWRQEPSTGGKGKTRMARQLRLDRVCYAWNDGTASSQLATTSMSVPSAKGSIGPRLALHTPISKERQPPCASGAIVIDKRKHIRTLR